MLGNLFLNATPGPAQNEGTRHENPRQHRKLHHPQRFRPHRRPGGHRHRNRPVLTPATSEAAAATQPQPAAAKPMIGFQAEDSYLLQYGIARFLDDVQTRASVNTLFLHCSPYSPSWNGLDKSTNPSGNFATAHPQFYRDVFMKPQNLAAGDPDLSDTLQKITAETRKRGIKIFPWMEEDNRPRRKSRGWRNFTRLIFMAAVPPATPADRA